MRRIKWGKLRARHLSEFGKRVRAAALAKGLTQADLARACGISDSALSQLMTGASKQPAATTLTCLSRTLQVSGEWLLSGGGSAPAVGADTLEEVEALSLFRAMSEANHEAWLTVGRALLHRQDDPPSAAAPFAGSLHEELQRGAYPKKPEPTKS